MAINNSEPKLIYNFIKEKLKEKNMSYSSFVKKCGFCYSYIYYTLNKNERHITEALTKSFISTLELSPTESEKLYDLVAINNNELPFDLRNYYTISNNNSYTFPALIRFLRFARAHDWSNDDWNNIYKSLVR